MYWNLEFLGRTEVRISDILQDSKIYRGPLIKRLPLYEVESGEIVLKLDLQLFSRRWFFNALSVAFSFISVVIYYPKKFWTRFKNNDDHKLPNSTVIFYVVHLASSFQQVLIIFPFLLVNYLRKIMSYHLNIFKQRIGIIFIYNARITLKYAKSLPIAMTICPSRLRKEAFLQMITWGHLGRVLFKNKWYPGSCEKPRKSALL